MRLSRRDDRDPLTARQVLRRLGVLAAALALLASASGARAAMGDEAGHIALVGARVYRSPDQPPVADALVLIDADRITKVAPRRGARIPAKYRVIDLHGAVVTAGFWNSHVHLTTPRLLDVAKTSDKDLQAELDRDFNRWGFTTVFDLASTSSIAMTLRERLSTGSIRGPRVLSVMAPFYPRKATPIYARPVYAAYDLPSAEVASDRDAVERARRQIRNGADGVKLFTGAIVGEREVVHMPAATIAALSQAAHALHKPVFAHPTDRQGVELALMNGVDVLAHAAPLMGSWSPEDARRLVARRVAMIPTLSLFEAQPNAATPVEVAVQQAAALHRAGGLVLFGTDAGFAETYDTRPELRLLDRALGWPAVLASLTTAPAAVFGEAALRGRVAPGYAADLVVLGGDPANDVANLADIRWVIRGGRIIFAR